MIKVNYIDLDLKTYPNGETVLLDALLPLVDNVSNTIEVKFQSDADLMQLYFVKKWLDDLHGEAENTLVIKYFPYSRADRSEDDSAFTLKYVAQFINDMWFDHVIIHEPHSYMTVALLDRVTVVDETLRVAHIALNSFDIEKDFVMFPDAGAEKRYAKAFKGWKTVTATKVRNFSTGEITGLTLNVDEIFDNVLIVDDLSSAGGTFYYSALALKKAGAGRIELAVTHCEDTIFNGKLLDIDSPVDLIHTTDSLLTKTHKKILVY